MPEGFVTLTEREFQRMLDRDKQLIALEAAGVDNWDGYSYAMEYLQETFPETWRRLVGDDE